MVIIRKWSSSGIGKVLMDEPVVEKPFPDLLFLDETIPLR